MTMVVKSSWFGAKGLGLGENKAILEELKALGYVDEGRAQFRFGIEMGDSEEKGSDDTGAKTMIIINGEGLEEEVITLLKGEND